jgi:hypothetical protein
MKKTTNNKKEDDNKYEKLDFMLRLMNDLDNAFYRALMLELVNDYVIEAINKPDPVLDDNTPNQIKSEKLSLYDQVLSKALDLEEKGQDGFKYIEKFAKKLGDMSEFISNSIIPQLSDICKEYNIIGFENE